MTTYKFNDRSGNRGRDCNFCIIHAGKAFTQYQAVENKMASFTSLKYVKDGKWSNTDWQVNVNSAKLVVFMEPFSYWTNDMQTCIEHIITECSEYIGYTPTEEEALIAFEFCCPKAFKKCQEVLTLNDELI